LTVIDFKPACFNARLATQDCNRTIYRSEIMRHISRSVVVALMFAVTLSLLAACGSRSDIAPADTGSQDQEHSTETSPQDASDPHDDSEAGADHGDSEAGADHGDSEAGADHGDSEADADHGDSEAGADHGDSETDADHGDSEAGADHGDDHDGDDPMAVAMAHGIPAEAATVPNPIAYDEESVTAGAELFFQTCVVCHGPEGRGDGPGAAGLEPKPASLIADHVQANSDGALFYTISNGRPNTAMVAWAATYSETERWYLVNYIRSLAAE
jgi:mono/diheme cytochrome c family protein